MYFWKWNLEFRFYLNKLPYLYKFRNLILIRKKRVVSQTMNMNEEYWCDMKKYLASTMLHGKVKFLIAIWYY